MSQMQNDPDRDLIEKTCDLIAQCGRIEGHPLANASEVADAASRRRELTETLIRHIGFSRSLAVLDAVTGGAS